MLLAADKLVMEEEESQASSQNESCDNEEDVEMEEEEPTRRRKPGIVYLSSIPPGMNPQLVREFLGEHGEIGKSFLQPIESKFKSWYTQFLFTFLLNCLYHYRTRREEKEETQQIFRGLGGIP